jgi:hypothetical protein
LDGGGSLFFSNLSKTTQQYQKFTPFRKSARSPPIAEDNLINKNKFNNPLTLLHRRNAKKEKADK